MNGRSRLAALDGVRGVAVALVVVHHVVVRDDDPLIRGGWLGVDLFFVLSGYLITRSVLDRPDLGDFLRRRFWRMAPAGVVLLATFAVLSIGASDAGQRAEWVFAALTQWANVQGAVGPPFSPHLGHLWSLSAEVQFYAVWGTVLSLLVRRRASRRAVAAVLLGLFVLSALERAALWHGGTPWNRLYLGPDTHSASLVAGCLLGLAESSGWLRGRRVFAVLSVPAAIVLGWSVVEVSFLDDRTYEWGLTVAAVAGAIVVASTALGAPSPLRPLFELPLATWLGRISYSLYLWHLPIIEEVERRRPDGDIVGIAVIAIPLSLLVGWTSYALIERPLMSSHGRARVWARLAKVQEHSVPQ